MAGYPQYSFTLTPTGSRTLNSYKLRVVKENASHEKIQIYSQDFILDRTRELGFLDELEDVSLRLHSGGRLEIVALSKGLNYQFAVPKLIAPNHHLEAGALTLFVTESADLETPILNTGHISIFEVKRSEAHFTINHIIDSRDGRVNLSANNLDIQAKVRAQQGRNLHAHNSLNYGPDTL